MSSSVSRRLFLSAAAAGLASRFARAQDATFSTDVSVVNVLATVRDSKGHIVSDLNKDDFTLSEEGRPKTIQYFSRETNLPLTLGLLVDTSGSMRRELPEERTATRRFIEKVLREDQDQTFLIHFDHDTELLQDLTNSRAKLEKALEELELPRDQRPQLNRRGGGGYPGGGGPFPGRAGGGRGGAGTTLYDAVFLAGDELMRKRRGRKALILMSDGVDEGSKESLTSAIESAQRADTLVYTILYPGEQNQVAGPFGRGGGRGGRRGGRFPQAQRERPDGRKVMQQLARETGGGFFEVKSKTSIDDVYDRIEEELRNQYNLGFSSDSGGSSGYRHIAVTVKTKGMVVQTRDGYYPGS